jgi:hypothetical protein
MEMNMEANNALAATVQVGTLFIRNSPVILRTLELKSESYLGTWDVLNCPQSPALDQRIRDGGSNYFFMAAEVRATVFGRLVARSIRKALKQIFRKVRDANFNSIEVTKITEKRFLGVPYITVCAHSRHLQQGSMMDFVHGGE